MSKWVIDLNERWLVHNVFGREEPDDELVIRYFNSIYGVKSVERFEEAGNAPEEKEKKYEVGDVYENTLGQLLIITNIDNGYINCVYENGSVDFFYIKNIDLVHTELKSFQGKMSLGEFFAAAEI